MTTQPESTRRRTCATYAGDMHAVENHMLEAFERQVAVTKEIKDANVIVQSLISASKRHAARLNDLVSSLGDYEKIVTDKVKSAIAGFFGVAAGLVDTVRPLAASKALRDDYTALSHAIVGYVLLSTTAASLKNQETKIIADEFLDEYINLQQQIMAILPTLALKDLSDEGVQLVDINAAQDFKTSKKWNVLFSREALKQETSASATATTTTPLTSTVAQETFISTEPRTTVTETVVAPNKIIVEKTTITPATVGVVDSTVYEKIVRPVIVEETFRPEKITEVQPVVHREIQANEIHHIERHIYERVETTGPTVVTNKPIVQEVIRPHIIEDVQEIVHRDLPAPYVERVEQHTSEVEVMPTLHTKEVILEKEEVLKADLIVEETQKKGVIAVGETVAVNADVKL